MLASGYNALYFTYIVDQIHSVNFRTGLLTYLLLEDIKEVVKIRKL